MVLILATYAGLTRIRLLLKTAFHFRNHQIWYVLSHGPKFYGSIKCKWLLLIIKKYVGSAVLITFRWFKVSAKEVVYLYFTNMYNWKYWFHKNVNVSRRPIEYLHLRLIAQKNLYCMIPTTERQRGRCWIYVAVTGLYRFHLILT